jgi:hypothetical protein
MTRSIENPFGQPSLEDLMVRFLASRSDASAGAVEHVEGDVEPHEVAAGFRVDPRAAWTDANDALTAARPDQAKGSALSPLPTEWATLVAQPSAAFAVAMAAGNFPQRVKDLQPLLSRFDPAELRPSGSQPATPGFAGLRGWAAKQAKTNPLMAAGIARALGDFDLAAERLAAEAGAECENEQAALLWHRGECAVALDAWNALAETPAVLFNRGMAFLFLGKLPEARVALAKAVGVLPEHHGWNALAKLYLALAEIHG